MTQADAFSQISADIVPQPHHAHAWIPISPCLYQIRCIVAAGIIHDDDLQILVSLAQCGLDRSGKPGSRVERCHQDGDERSMPAGQRGRDRDIARIERQRGIQRCQAVKHAVDGLELQVLRGGAVRLLPDEQHPVDPVGDFETRRRTINTWWQAQRWGIGGYIDIVPAMSGDDETILPAYDADGTHLNAAGFQAVADRISGTYKVTAPAPLYA